MDPLGALALLALMGRGHAAAVGLQALVDAAPVNSVVRISPGRYEGPLVIDRGVTVEGPSGAVVRSNGRGTTVRILGPGGGLVGVTVEGSGRRYDRQDAAVYVRGDRVRVVGVTMKDCLFGIWAESGAQLVFKDDRVIGQARLPLGLRGDGVHLWEVRDSLIQGCVVRDCQDVAVWYSPRNRLVRDRITGSRYGTHFMFSDGGSVRDCVYRGDVVGIFCMYSRGVSVRSSEFVACSGAAGFGFGAKESGDLDVEGCAFHGDTVGLHLESTPFEPGDSDVFRDDTFRSCGVAVALNGTPRGNRFLDDSFVGCRPLEVEDNGTGEGAFWWGNYYGDYQGYGLIGDGFGDVPYESRDLEDDLIHRNPAMGLFLGSPALALVAAADRVLPLIEPTLILKDFRPRLAPPRTAPQGGGVHAD